MDTIMNWINENSGLIIHYAVQAVLALIIFFIGGRIAKFCEGLTEKAFDKKKVDKAVGSFVSSIVYAIVFMATILMALSQIGIETTSFIAILGAAGLAVGLALQGSLANFAGGVLILFFRPFKVGDLIEAQGFLGIVKEIQIFVTILTTLDNRRIIIPNGPLSNGCITNLNAESLRRVDMTFGISYGDDVLKAKEVIQKVLAADERILKDPKADVYVSKHGDSSVNFAVRPWVHPDHYWGVYFHMHEQLKLAFDREGITIPFPQRDVHIYNHEEN